MVSRLDSGDWTTDRMVRVQALTAVHCVVEQDTRAVPIFTQAYEWIPGILILQRISPD